MIKFYSFSNHCILQSVKFLAVFAVVLGTFSQSAAQCINTIPYGTNPAPTYQTVSSTVFCTYAEEVNTWTALAAGTAYIASSTIATDFITVEEAGTGTVIAFGTSPVAFTAVGSGTYYTHINTNASCGTQQNCRDITITYVPPAFDATLVGITSPVTACGLTSADSIRVDVLNSGSDTITGIDLYYVLNGATPVTQNFPDTILPGATQNFTFSTTGDFSTIGAHTVQAYLVWAADAIGANDTVNTTIFNSPLFNTFPYHEDFEDSVNYWVAGGSNSSWALGTPANTTINSAASGINSWITNLTGNYNNSEISHVTSPCFDFTSLQNPWILMNVWWSNESNYDGAILQSSVDGGATWQKVGAFGDPYNWYNNDNMSSAVAGQYEAWNGSGTESSGGWVQVKHALTGLGGMSDVKIRVLFDSDPSVNGYDGFAFDDVVITEPPVVSLGSDTTVCGVYSLDAGNPGAIYTWSTGDTTQVLNLEFASGMTHVTVSDTFGLSVSDTAFITVRPNPYADLGPDVTICNNSTVVLNPGGGNNTYLWNNGSTSQTIYVSTWVPSPTSLNFSVEVTNQYGCMDSDSISIFVQNCTSIAEMDAEENISVFPNPSNGVVSLTIPASVLSNGSAFVTILNMLGEEVLSNTLSTESTTLDLSNLATGVYHLRVRGEHFDKVSRVVINR